MNKLIKLIESRWLSVTLFLLALITLLSLWPAEELPPVPGSDKIHHMIAYTALTIPVALTRPRHWKLLALLFIVFSGVIELLQPFVNRYAEWLDLAANAAGVLCGVLLAQLICHYRRDSDQG